MASVLKDAEGHLKALCLELRDKVTTFPLPFPAPEFCTPPAPGFNHDSLQVGQSFRSSKDELLGDSA